MLFNSLQFWIFFPIITILYFCIPVKYRNLWLLFTSWFFYMCWNPKYIVLLLGITVVTYGSGILLKYTERKIYRMSILTGGILICLGVLFFYKYINFFIDTTNHVRQIIGIADEIQQWDIILPVGISFYTFQGIGYVIDVYRDKNKCEKNFILYALFISFFPQLVAGPIERSDNIIKQFKVKHEFDYLRVKNGLLLMAWGMFMKIMIADRLAIVVDQVFSDYISYTGIQLLMAAVFFGVQIYCDFAGYSNIAIGAARVMGFSLMKNFEQPYLATSVSDFWRRWHISLTSWFRDYLYISLGGNRKGILRKYANLIIVFLISGLWHGAGWNFFFWGGVNGLYQVIGRATSDMRRHFRESVGINDENRLWKVMQCIITFSLIDITWIFFRAEGIQSAWEYIKRMFCNFEVTALFNGQLFLMGLEKWEFVFSILLIIFLFVVEYCQWYKALNIKFFETTSLLYKYRWIVYSIYIVIMVVQLCRDFGIDSATFIYFQF